MGLPSTVASIIPLLTLTGWSGQDMRCDRHSAIGLANISTVLGVGASVQPQSCRDCPTTGGCQSAGSSSPGQPSEPS